MESQSLHFTTTHDSLILDAAGASRRGTNRLNNEDAIHLAPNLEMLIVADGVGGNRAGELASSTAIREVIEETDNWPVSGDDDHFRQLIDQALHHASRVICELIEIDDEFWGAATTMTLAFRADDHLFVANVGDSRAYRLRNGRLEQLTVDDSWVEILVRAGSLTRKQAKHHPQRNVILTSLGGTDFEEQKVEVGVMSLQSDDRFLISSDGLHDALSDGEIAECLGKNAPPQDIVDQLIDAAIDAGSTDDVSAVVLSVSAAQKESTAFANAWQSVTRLLSGKAQPAPAGN